MKAPELNELISESYPITNDYIIEQLKNKLYELEQENIFYKQENNNLEEEIKESKKSEYELKSKLSLLMTQNNSLKDENTKMQIVNEKLVEDNKILMAEIDKKINQINIIKEKLSLNEENKTKNEQEEKDILIDKLNNGLTEQENYIKKLFEDNKELNENNKNIMKETEEKINELNMNIKVLNEEINSRDDKIAKLEEEFYKINKSLEQVNKENVYLNNMNIALKEKNKELNDNLNYNKNIIIDFEKKNNSILLELDKKEKIINDFQEKYKTQSKQISNLMNKYNSLINNNKDSLILMNKIKSSNFDIFSKYENANMKLTEIKNIYESDDSLEKILKELKKEIINGIGNKKMCDENSEKNKEENIENNSEGFNNFRNYIDDNKNKDEMTMDNKYSFLFENNKK